MLMAFPFLNFSISDDISLCSFAPDTLLFPHSQCSCNFLKQPYWAHYFSAANGCLFMVWDGGIIRSLFMEARYSLISGIVELLPPCSPLPSFIFSKNKPLTFQREIRIRSRKGIFAARYQRSLIRGTVYPRSGILDGICTIRPGSPPRPGQKSSSRFRWQAGRSLLLRKDEPPIPAPAIRSPSLPLLSSTLRILKEIVGLLVFGNDRHLKINPRAVPVPRQLVPP